MNTLFHLILLHAVLLIWIMLSGGHLWGHWGERSFSARIPLFKKIMGERYDDKTYYINWLKIFYSCTLPLSIIIYLILLLGILQSR